MKLITLLSTFLSLALTSTQALAQSPIPGTVGTDSGFSCRGGTLYAARNPNTRIGQFSTQTHCLEALYSSQWGLICSGSGSLANGFGNEVDKYWARTPDLAHEDCLVSLIYSTFSPSEICSGRIKKNLGRGFVKSYDDKEACWASMGYIPPQSHD